MTLNDILVSALSQLDRGHDAQTLDIFRSRLETATEGSRLFRGGRGAIAAELRSNKPEGSLLRDNSAAALPK